MLAILAQLPLPHHLQPRRPKHRVGVTNAAGVQHIDLFVQLPIQLAQAGPHIGLHQRANMLRLQAGLGKFPQPRLKGRQIGRRERKAARRSVAAMLGQQVFAIFQGFKHVEFRDAAGGTAHLLGILFFVSADEHGRAVTLHQPGGDNPDRPVVPIRLHHQHHPRRLQIQIAGLIPGMGFLLNLVANLLALLVDFLALHGPLQGLTAVIGGQQVDHHVRLVNPPHGVDPRPEPKADRLRFQGAFAGAGRGVAVPLPIAGHTDPRHLLQGANSGNRGKRQQTEAPPDPAPIHAGQGRKIGDRPQGEQLQQGFPRGRSLHPLGQSHGQHVGHADPGQSGVGRGRVD